MQTPSKAQKTRLVRLLARYILVDGAHISRQQRAYDAYMAYFEQLEASYPNVDLRAEVSTESLVRAAKAEASKKLFTGPGATR